MRTFRLTPAALVALVMLLGACSKESPPARPAPPTEVTTITVQSRSVPVSAELAGRTAAYAVAEIRPQIGGIVQKRLFKEGSEVRAGQVLYQIDSAAAKATVASAQATLASAQAGLAAAREKAGRYKELIAIDAVSRESADEADAAYQQARALVAAQQAGLDTARLSLGYSAVKSPINGRIGRSSVSQGALLVAGQGEALATVQQLDPIFVDVTQTAAELLRVRRDIASGKIDIGGDGSPTVSLLLEDGSQYGPKGKLLLAEALVDPSSGSITLRAQFPNPKRELLPGMYVRATLGGAVAQQVLVVPQAALSRDAKGNALALLVGADDMVEQRVLTTSQAVGDQWIVSSGLKAGDRVIVEGLQKVRPGMKVKATEAVAAASAPVGK